MAGTVLHLLSQRPLLTGSGITLDALVRLAGEAGWEQGVLCGQPSGSPPPQVGELPADRIRTLCFGEGALPFAIPGMSDRMPYESTRFSSLRSDQLDAYRTSWRKAVAEAVESFRPDVIHSHHLWLLSSIVKEICPRVPQVIHCHATGLRQFELCPHLREQVLQGCARADRFVVLEESQAQRLQDCLGIPPERITVAGAGYREELFHEGQRSDPGENQLLYVGKFARAKGLDELLAIVPALAKGRSGFCLHVAGAGGGEEGREFEERMKALGARVQNHGRLDPAELARLMGRVKALVLPSYYEGLPLVLVEALACGCRLVATDLPGGLARLKKDLGSALLPVRPPRLAIDVPEKADLPAFRERLLQALCRALDEPAPTIPSTLEDYRWSAVFRRVQSCWKDSS